MRYIFGEYVLDTQRQELHRAGEPSSSGARCFRCSPTSWRIASGSFPSRNSSSTCGRTSLSATRR